MTLFDRLALSTLPLIPTAIMRRLAGRYIAGETLPQAMERLEALAREGYPGIVDVLGEDVRDAAQARRVAEEYRLAADGLAQRRLDAYVSIKPTHVGLNLSEDLAHELYDGLARHCGERGLFMRVEMEDHPTTDGTLRVFERLRREHSNVGIVLQARLLRTPEDVRNLAPGPLNVRLVKGIYLEPAPIAHTEPEPIRQAFLQLVDALAERGAFIGLATHDEVLAERALARLAERGTPREQREFQVLLGVREPLWAQWRAAGESVRVYVPFGPEWRPYSTRRLRKNPQIFRHVMRDTLTFWR